MISFFSRLLENDEFQNLQSCKECANKPTCTCRVFASVTNKVSEWSLTVNEMPKTPELQGGSAPTCRSHANLRTLHSLRSHMFYPIINNLAPPSPQGDHSHIQMLHNHVHQPLNCMDPMAYRCTIAPFLK